MLQVAALVMLVLFQPPAGGFVNRENDYPIDLTNYREFEMPKLDDPAFVKYFLVSDMIAAFNSRDSDKLIDIALHLAECERVLYRKHVTGITAEKLLCIASGIATENKDDKSIQRLKAISSESRFKKLIEVLAKSVSISSRSDDSDLLVSLDKTDPEKLARFQRHSSDIQAATVLKDIDGLKRIMEEVNTSIHFTEAQKKELANRVSVSMKLLASNIDEDDKAISRVVITSRSMAGPVAMYLSAEAANIARQLGNWEISYGPIVNSDGSFEVTFKNVIKTTFGGKQTTWVDLKGNVLNGSINVHARGNNVADWMSSLVERAAKQMLPQLKLKWQEENGGGGGQGGGGNMGGGGSNASAPQKLRFVSGPASMGVVNPKVGEVENRFCVLYYLPNSNEWIVYDEFFGSQSNKMTGRMGGEKWKFVQQVNGGIMLECLKRTPRGEVSVRTYTDQGVAEKTGNSPWNFFQRIPGRWIHD